MQFNFHKKNLPKVKNGVDVNTPEIAKIMKAVSTSSPFMPVVAKNILTFCVMSKNVNSRAQRNSFVAEHFCDQYVTVGYH